MSTTKNVQMSEFNRTDYDILLPQTRLDFELGNEYIWAKEQWNWEVVKSDSTKDWTLVQTNNINRTYVRYSDNIILDNDGNISLAEPITQIYPTYNSAGSLKLDNKYVQLGRNSYAEAAKNPVWFSDGVTFVSGNTYRLTYRTVNALYRRTLLGYVNSPSSDAYPPAVSDGYTYAALGQLGAKLSIEIGSYIGTGTYGSNNKNILTFKFVPKFAVVYLIGNYSGSEISSKIGAYAIFFHDAPTALVSISDSADNSNNGYLQNLWCEWNGNQLSWYSNKDASKQLNWKNTSNNKYFGKYGYIAIG